MSTDGKYCTFTYFKEYFGQSRTDPNNPSVYNNFVVGSPDDNVLNECLLQAETVFEQSIGNNAFDQQTYTMVQSFTTWVDGNGWLWLCARERGPVTAVNAVQVRDLQGRSATWKDVAFTDDNIILPPYSVSDTHPYASSWRVRIFPTQPLPCRSTGQVLARWSYTGGYASDAIPSSLSNLIARIATFIYKTREIPMGQIVNTPLGVMKVPNVFPKDITALVEKWRPVYG